MESKIEIADLVKPKFEPGSEVYRVVRDTRHRINSVQRVVIERVRFTVTFRTDYNGRNQTRETDLAYDLLGNGTAHEESLFATLGEIKELA